MTFELTSLRRLKSRYKFATTVSDAQSPDAHLQSFISSWSERIKYYCRRDFQYGAKVDLFNADEDQRTFRVAAYPIASVTSVLLDATGKYTTSYTTLSSDSYLIDRASKAVILSQDLSSLSQSYVPNQGWARMSNVKINYAGGLAEHGTRINVTLNNVTSLVVGDTITGVTSQASGYLMSASGTSAMIDVSYGAFEDGETVSNGTVTKTLVQHDTDAICETDPTLTNCCEIMVRWSWSTLVSPGYKTSEGNRTDRFTPDELANSFTFLPEVRDLLEPYVNKVIRR